MCAGISGQIPVTVWLICNYILGYDATQSSLGDMSMPGAFTVGVKTSYAYIGTKIHVLCTLGESVSRDAKDLVISLHNDFCDNNCTMQNESSEGNKLIVEVNITSEQAAGQYFCWLQRSPSSQLEFVNSWKLYVQYVLQEPINVLCTVYDWDQSLTCSWNYGVLYINNTDINHLESSDIKVQVYVRTENSMVPCPQLLSAFEENSICVWMVDHFWAADKYLLVINLTNSIGSNCSTMIVPIITQRIVKPSPVVNVHVTQRNSSCVVLAWTHQREHRDKVFRVNVSTGATQILSYSHALVCSLEPYTAYFIFVETRAVNHSEQLGYWSEPVAVRVSTDQEVPGSSFQVENGSYILHDCVDGKRNITIFWKPVPAQKRHGEIIGYRLVYNGTILDVEDENPMFAFLPFAVCGSDISVSIFSRTSVGLSTTSAEIYIKECHSTVPDFAVQVLSGRLLAVWNSSEAQDSNCGIYGNNVSKWENVTVFWCLKDTFHNGQLCKGEIEWENVRFSSDELSILLSDQHKDSPYDFLVGISHQMMAIQWAQCYFQIQAPVNAVPEVQVYPVDGKLVVSWTPQQCSQNYPVHILGYIIMHSPVYSGVTNEEYVHGWRSSALQVPVVQGIQYNITVQAVAYHNQRGPPSEPVIKLLPQTDDFTPVGYIGLVICVLLIFGCLLVLIIRFGYAKYQQAEEKFSNFDFNKDFVPLDDLTYCEQPEQCNTINTTVLSAGVPPIDAMDDYQQGTSSSIEYEDDFEVTKHRYCQQNQTPVDIQHLHQEQTPAPSAKTFVYVSSTQSQDVNDLVNYCRHSGVAARTLQYV